MWVCNEQLQHNLSQLKDIYRQQYCTSTYHTTDTSITSSTSTLSSTESSSSTSVLFPRVLKFHPKAVIAIASVANLFEAYIRR